jgi:hypothetical protein
MREQLMAGITGFFQINQTIKDSNSTLHHRISNFGEGVVNRNNNLKVKISTSDDSLTQFSSSISNSLHSSSTNLQNDLKNICQSAFTDLKNCDSLLDDCQNCLKKKEKEHSDMVLTLGYRSQETTNTLIHSVKSTNTKICETLKTCLEELNSTSTDTVNFGSGHFTSSSHLQEGITTFNYKSYVTSGETPLKKNYAYPNKLTHSRPESEIILSYRQSLDSSYTEPSILQETSVSLAQSLPEEEVQDNTELTPSTSVENSSNRNSLSSKAKIAFPGDTVKNNSTKSNDLNQRIQGNVNNNKLRQTKPMKMSIGAKGVNSSLVENQVVVGSKLNGGNGKERNRLADLTNQLKAPIN